MLELLFFVFLTCGAMLLAFLTLCSIRWREQSGDGLVQVVVLGDAGRSPRMQYHCLSLVQQKYTVDLIGYGGSSLIKELRDSRKLTHWELTEPPSILNLCPHLLRYVLKVLFQILNLVWVIFVHTRKPSHILVQTPPAIPTLLVVVLATIIRGSKLIVDYHNYGYTLMALTHGPKHFIVRIAKEYERIFSGFAYANLCVSEAMKRDLRKSLRVNAIILYDRPPSMFQPATLEMKHKLFLKLAKDNPVFGPGNALIESGGSATLFTEQSASGVVTLRHKRPFLLISSTSWTEDEDFGVLLEALEMYEEKASDKIREFPNIMCIITGKGPQKSYYEKLIASKRFKHVTICTLWLSSEDYPVLVGSADLGVCLHKSSSGLDLPMKVVDMFGCGLPVCAMKFNCLHEVLQHGHNGLIFSNSVELAGQLQYLADGFPVRKSQLSTYRDNLSSFQSLRWHHYWKLHVLPLINPPN